MTDDSPRRCPWCAEEIKAQASICPHCRTRLTAGHVRGPHRSRPGRKLAGVAVAIAASLGVSATVIRLALVLVTLVNPLLGAGVYLLLWILLPFEAGAGRSVDLAGDRR